jgi:hypothetical protein
MTDTPEEPEGEQPPRSLHHRIYPYMDEMVQYATERADELSDPDARPWIVRDRSTALRNERQGRGRALVRVWIPTSWEYVNVEEEDK